MSDPFYTFIAWVKFDARITQYQAHIVRLSKEAQAIDMKVEANKQAQERAYREVVQAKKLVDQQELAIRVLRDREKKIIAQRDASTSSKEYVSLDAQIKAIIAELDEHENKLFELFAAYETTQKAYAEYELTYLVEQAGDAQRKAVVEQAIHEQRELLHAAQPEYEKLKNNINPDFLSRFFDRKTRVPDPVVAVTHASCSACSYMVVSQDMVRLRKHELVPCQQCYRLLYMSEGI